MKRAPVRHRAEYAAYLALRATLGRLSRPALRRFGHRLGRLAFRLDRRHRRVALANLALALPEIAEGPRPALARACFEHWGATFLEVALAARLRPDDVEALFDVEGWEHVEAAEALGRGLLLISGHFGSFELAAYPLGLRLGEIHMLARPPDNPFVDRDLRRVRQRFGNRLIDKRGAARRMLTVLRRRGRVGVAIDQRVRPSQGIRVPFLGHPVWTSPVPAYLAILTGAPVVPLFSYPTPEGRFRLRCDPAIDPGEYPEGPQGEAALARRCLATIETEVRRRPELWLWMHRLWEAGTPGG